MTLRSERRNMLLEDVIVAVNAAPESEMVKLASLSERMKTSGDISEILRYPFGSLLGAKGVAIGETEWKKYMDGLHGRVFKAIPLPKRWLW